ncbi:AraC family transcriptional regulator [Seonamhaeicola maritimus]|uniref:AraC family transcriptional regulator n=2 Tax=Seonamhaeicola maritimus TaxID=2591822 RepID=A0A5C7GJD3_9FLAO|nr:AraC family transcriptional regulator [Seonamhaeicola maritimus]
MSQQFPQILNHFYTFGLLNIFLLYILILAYSDKKTLLWYGAFVLSIGLELFNYLGLNFLYNYSTNLTLAYLPWIAFVPISLYKYVLLRLNVNGKNQKRNFRFMLITFFTVFLYFMIKSYYVLLGDLNLRDQFFLTEFTYPKIEYWINGAIIITMEITGICLTFTIIKPFKLNFRNDVYILLAFLFIITTIHIISFIDSIISGPALIISNPNNFYLTVLTILGLIISYRKILGLNYKPESLQQKTVNEKTKSDNSQLKIIEEKILVVMEEGDLYKNPKLQLKDLSKAVKTSDNYISEVFSKQLETNYYDFINSYRVEEVIRLMKLETHIDYKLMAIAKEAGFNSKTTFNTAFKKSTGLTPSQYRKQLS